MEEKGSMPLIGEKFPDMEVQTTHGRKKLPDEFKGKWFVLFSHPADNKSWLSLSPAGQRQIRP